MTSYASKLTDNRLRKLLHTKFGQPQIIRNPKTVHVSMLTDTKWGGKEYCPRESALSYLNDANYGTRWIGTAERLTYDMGWFAQAEVTRRLMAHLIGEWHCLVCDNAWRGEYQVCACGNEQPAYQELHFRSPLTGVMGSIDLCANVGFPKPVIIEVKSMATDEFKKLVMPMLEHRLRVIGYLQLLREAATTDAWIADTIELDFGYVLYISKGMGKYFKNKEGGVNDRFSPFQEYMVEAKGNPLKDVEEMYERAAIYWVWRNADQPEQIPPRIFNCPQSECKRAARCPVREECWHGK